MAVDIAATVAHGVAWGYASSRMGDGFEVTPRGDFSLSAQAERFGGWPAYPSDPAAIAMTFPVEGWESSATVVLRQPSPTLVSGEVFGATGDLAQRAWQQALATLSLDIDGGGFAAVGERDPVIGQVQAEYPALRPTLFHSPYEAATNFIIGQRISMAQARAIRTRMAEESGDAVEAGGVTYHAFPRPQQLLGLDSIRSLADEKVRRLHSAAQAALDGVLDRAALRALPVTHALAAVSRIHGVGPFSAQGIVHRGAGVVDELTDEPVGKEAVQRLYGLDHEPSHAEVEQIAEAWRPYRMWTMVLLHVWIRNQGGGPTRARQGRRS